MKPNSFDMYKGEQEKSEKDNGYLRSFAKTFKEAYDSQKPVEPKVSKESNESQRDTPSPGGFRKVASGNGLGKAGDLEKKLDDAARELSNYTFKNSNNATLKELGSVLYAKVLHDLYNDFFK